MSQSSYKSARTLLYTFLLVGALKGVPNLVGKPNLSTKLHILLRKYLEPSTLRTALFPAVLPHLYRKWRLTYPKECGLPEILSSPSLLLLSRSLRIQVALYFAGSALQNTAQRSRFKSYLPPIWWLNVIANTWLLMAFLLHTKSFPKAYDGLLLAHPNYVPPDWDREKLRTFLAYADAWPLLTQENAPNNGFAPGHKRLFCATLHPNEPSCLKNYLKAWVHESKKAVKWVGAFGALTMFLTRRQLLKENPRQAFKEWVISTARGTAFVVGSVNTAWGLMCPTQRILPPNVMPVSRWLIHGSLGSLWILALPAARRGEISMYAARLGALCLWDVWQRKTGLSFSYGEVLLFALSWAQLSRLRQEGAKIGGLVGRGLNFIEPTISLF